LRCPTGSGISGLTRLNDQVRQARSRSMPCAASSVRRQWALSADLTPSPPRPDIAKASVRHVAIHGGSRRRVSKKLGQCAPRGRVVQQKVELLPEMVGQWLQVLAEAERKDAAGRAETFHPRPYV